LKRRNAKSETTGRAGGFHPAGQDGFGESL
jgi:hypothetical protein